MMNDSVLIVDENKVAVRELANILKYAAISEVRHTDNANDAWAMMRMGNFSCIIAAWEMPEMSGISLLRIARDDDRLHNVPFFLTHSAFTKVKVIQAGQAGVSGLIVRPFDLDNITDKMKSLKEITRQSLPGKAEETFEEGMRLIEKEDYTKALEVFEELTEKGETAEHYYNIGYIKTAQEKYNEAIPAFRKATQLDRLFAKAYEAMGRAYHHLGKAGEAEKYLQKAANIYLEKEKVQNAEEILNEILQISPDTVNVYNSLGVLYRKKGDFKTALNNYMKALRIHQEEPHIHYNIGRLHLDMKDFQAAKKHFSLATKYDPDFKEAAEVLQAMSRGSF